MVNLISLVIISIGFFFRFFQLTQYPVHLSMDEANIAINAYSILKTGHDEWGEFLPLAFKSAGDYKPPVNIYLTAVSIAIFGYNEFAVRFPTALFSFLTIFAIKSILEKMGLKKNAVFAGMFFLAISPWHSKFSRSGYEAITALAFTLFGFSCYLNWQKNYKFTNIFFSIFWFSLSVWTYHAQRLFIPILFIFLFLNTIRLTKNKKLLFKQVLLSFLLLLPLIIPFIKITFFSQAVKSRASATLFLNDSSLQLSLKNQPILIKHWLIFHHWIGKYVDYFDLRFLFLKGLEFTPEYQPDVGLLYLVDLPIFIIGVINLLKSKSKENKKYIIFWLLTGIIPASLTINNLHPLRALTWLPAFVFIYSYAFENFSFFKFYIPFILINIIYFLIIYTKFEPYYLSEFRQYGQKQFSEYVCQSKDKYDHIKITDTFGSLGPLNTGIPYVYYLFYCKIDPNTFQTTSRNFDNIIYSRPNWKNDKNMKNTLFVGSPWDFVEEVPSNSNIIQVIKFLNGKDGFWLVETNPISNEKN